MSAEPLLDQALPPVQPSEGPEFVQLLTPEGERVEHPDYPLDISDDEIQSLYRDLVLVRRIDTEATALQRQGELGLWASLLGQEAAQVGAGRALTDQGLRLPDLPGARRRVLQGRRPGHAARAVPRHQPGRLGPATTRASSSTRS